jgi:glycosyltransferase involved in cell wall biosynthesis
MKSTKISFIIPAYNEEQRIGKTINEIVDKVPTDFDYEIIVVDHGSRDATADIVAASPATLLSHPGGTIAGLRNYGVEHASGDILVFIDADVLLTENWAKRFTEIAPSLVAGEPVLTGSWVSVPNPPNWIEKNWFKPLELVANTHINSGHLIIAKSHFTAIGGFDSALETGEDYEISMRAKANGLRIVDDSMLEAIHEGYPQSLKVFFLRELWHGKGDAHSLSTIFQSKVALISTLFFVLHIMLVGSVCLKTGIYGAIIFSIICLLILTVTLTKYKKQRFSTIVINMCLYYVYFWARTFSLATYFSYASPGKRER